MSLMIKDGKLRVPYKATIRLSDTPISTDGVFRELGTLRIKVTGEIVNNRLNAVIEINDMPIISTSILKELKECLIKL
jgi:hypothetical protein